MYTYFAPGRYSYAAWVFNPSCGTGLTGDANVAGGCSPTNGTQSGERIASDTCGCDSPNSTGGKSAGEPIDIGSGNVTYHITDYETAGQNKLSLIRTYNSRTNSARTLGPNWQTNFDRSLSLESLPIVAVRPNGQQLAFNYVSGAYVPNNDVPYTLTNSGSTWTLKTPDDTTEVYTVAPNNAIGLITSITQRNGYTQTFTYTTTGTAIQLASVSDSYGRSITFTYNANGTLASATTPDSTTINYGYTTSSTEGPQLTSVTYPTSPSSSVTYAYGNTSYPEALTSITDEDGNIFQSWTYDAYGRGLTSAQGGSSLNANLTTIAYNDTAVTRTVANALGVTDTYTLTTSVNVPRVTQISRAATSTTAAASETFTYDSNGFLASIVDWNGNTTNYTNNSQGLPTTIVEAYGSSVARTTTIAYDSVFIHQPDSITTPGLTTSFTYDNTSGDPNYGALLTKTLTDTTTTSVPYSTNGQTRTWTNTWSNHLLATEKTPNGNTTTYGYNSNGALTSITDPLSHVTSFTSVTTGGRPLTMVNMNNITTTFTYDNRQRLLTQSINTTGSTTETTTRTLDAVGDLTKLTLGDGSYTSYAYDTAHRLDKVTDADSNYINYTLDALGDQTAINTYNSSGTQTREVAKTFDALGRELTRVGGGGLDTVTFTYDPNSNQLTVKDGNNHTTTKVYDALNRLHTSTDANSGVVTYAYDPHDQLLTVTDPNSHSTSYVRNGFEDMIQQASPDTGTSVFHYDSDANLTQKVDAVGNTANQTFDALDRILTTSYPADSTLNVSYTYDTAAWPSNGGYDVGRLTQRNDKAGFFAWDYDQFGNTVAFYHPNSPYIVFAYQYTLANRLGDIFNPDGFAVGYTYDAAGYLTGMNYLPPNGPVHQTYAWISNEPFGPITAIDFINYVHETRTYDLDYRMTNITVTNPRGTVLENQTYALDYANNVTSITDAVNASNSQTLGYDVINRLTSAVSGTGGYGTQSFEYDANGNLTQKVAGGTTYNYTYASGTNQLTGATWPSNTETMSYNANGNLTSITLNGSTVYTGTYSAANRLASESASGGTAISALVYDADGRRFSKEDSGASAPTYYGYGLGSTLGVEISPSGVTTDYINADGRVVGTFLPASSTLYFVDNDRLGTPQLATNSTPTEVWSAQYQPYGTTTPSGTITLNPRLPGQYYDTEVALNYNVNRDYSSNWGRYIEADPIGLGGGLNPYRYARANPFKFTDRRGLDSESEPAEADSETANQEEIVGGRALVDPDQDDVRPSEQDVLNRPRASTAVSPADPDEDEAGRCFPSQTPTGRRQNPLDTTESGNLPTVINGVPYSGHALDQMQGRGVTPTVVENTMTNGEPSSSYNGRTVYTDPTNGVRVVVAPGG